MLLCLHAHFCLRYVNRNIFTNVQVPMENFIAPFLRNPGRDISFPIFIRNKIETRKLERKSNQQISHLNDLYRLNDKISREIDIK